MAAKGDFAVNSIIVYFESVPASIFVNFKHQIRGESGKLKYAFVIRGAVVHEAVVEAVNVGKIKD